MKRANCIEKKSGYIEVRNVFKDEFNRLIKLESTQRQELIKLQVLLEMYLRFDEKDKALDIDKKIKDLENTIVETQKEKEYADIHLEWLETVIKENGYE